MLSFDKCSIHTNVISIDCFMHDIARKHEHCLVIKLHINCFDLCHCKIIASCKSADVSSCSVSLKTKSHMYHVHRVRKFGQVLDL